MPINFWLITTFL